VLEHRSNEAALLAEGQEQQIAHTLGEGDAHLLKEAQAKALVCGLVST
jgi:hypothetical protein